MHSITHGPSPVESRLEPAIGHSITLGDLGNTGGNSIHRNQAIPARVALLGLRRSPLAILGRVAHSILDSLKAFAGRTVSHIGVKVGERVPPFADRDASAAVGIPSGVVRVPASIQHRCPNSVNRGVALPVSWMGLARIGDFGRNCFRHSIGRSMLCLAAGPVVAGFRCAIINQPI